MRSCNRCEERVYIKDENDISVVKRKERRDMQVY